MHIEYDDGVEEATIESCEFGVYFDEPVKMVAPDSYSLEHK